MDAIAVWAGNNKSIRSPGSALDLKRIQIITIPKISRIITNLVKLNGGLFKKETISKPINWEEARSFKLANH